MPRIGRVVAANMPHHIVQRGHNRKTVFIEAADYRYYLNNLQEWSIALEVKILSWCLMSNHVHILVDPGENIANIGLMMKRIAGRQTRFFNRQKQGTGSLWDGRYKLSIVDSDQYFLAACRYIELNPVKAGIVSVPDAYQWSSFRENAGLEATRIVNRSRFQEYSDISPQEYNQFVNVGGDAKTERLIAERVESNRLTGSAGFVDEIESRTGIRVEFRKPGRPARQK